MKSITEVLQNLLKPYIDRNIETATGVLGAKNLMSNNATSRVVNGVTFTVNTDTSSDEYGVVTASGTASSNTQLHINDAFTVDVPVILNGCPSGGGELSYLLVAFDGTNYFADSGNGIALESGTYDIYILIYSGATVNAKFKPMIRPASIADDTYVPYAMTNASLTATSNQLSSRIGLQKITFDDEAGSVLISNVEFMIQRLPNDPYIRLIIYMHDQQNTRYICRFNSVEVVTN